MTWPRHQVVPRKAGVTPHLNTNLWPTLTDLSDDPFKLFLRAGTPIDVRAAQLGDQQVAATKDAQWQVTTAIILPMEGFAL
jgi:hypothetical protein